MESTDASLPKLLFTVEFDECTAWEVKQKGWFGCAVLRFPDGSEFPLTFFDPVRLSQDIEITLNRGEVLWAEPGLIVVPEVTERAMREAVTHLINTDYFKATIRRPVHDGDLK